MNWRYQAVVDDRDYTTHFLVSDAGERIHVWYMLFWRFAFDEAQKDVRFGAFRTSARAPMSEIEERSLGPNCEVRLLKKWPGNNQPLNVLRSHALQLKSALPFFTLVPLSAPPKVERLIFLDSQLIDLGDG